MTSTKVQRIMTQPIVQLDFQVSSKCKSLFASVTGFLFSKARIQFCLFEQKVESFVSVHVLGFDEYMNLVLDDAEEVNIKKKSKKSLGRILLK
ncbi:hypothetical protein SADUNF_Sadunf18G0078400 [Salix dunnii]|uniref:Sm protein E n=1 Tax=Salix dunnii TaxID=1413687 RepID=A0A835J6K2_9ROSI|nr:hypothetical protein SADUNF_Sadunf18G0078400 [Salix dunnii]